MIEILTANGFVFDTFCSVCKNRYKVFKNASKPGVEVKVHVSGNYFKAYKPNFQGRVTQVAFGNTDKLKQVIETL